MCPDALSRVWTRATVLDGHGGVCVTTYRQVSATFSSNGEFDIPRSHYLWIEILFRRSSTGLESLAD